MCGQALLAATWTSVFVVLGRVYIWWEGVRGWSTHESMYDLPSLPISRLEWRMCGEVKWLHQVFSRQLYWMLTLHVFKSVWEVFGEGYRMYLLKRSLYKLSPTLSPYCKYLCYWRLWKGYPRWVCQLCLPLYPHSQGYLYILALHCRHQ